VHAVIWKKLSKCSRFDAVNWTIWFFLVSFNSFQVRCWIYLNPASSSHGITDCARKSALELQRLLRFCDYLGNCSPIFILPLFLVAHFFANKSQIFSSLLDLTLLGSLTNYLFTNWPGLYIESRRIHKVSRCPNQFSFQHNLHGFVSKCSKST